MEREGGMGELLDWIKRDGWRDDGGIRDERGLVDWLDWHGQEFRPNLPLHIHTTPLQGPGGGLGGADSGG